MLRRLAPALALSLAAAACGARPAPVLVASNRPAPSTVLVMPARVCLERQPDVRGRPRAGEPGLVRTREVVGAIGASLPERRALDAFVADACDDLVDLDESPPRLERFVATRDLVARMKARGANGAFVTEIATRLVCAPRRGGMRTAPCWEEDVNVTVLLFDATGTIVGAASAHVDAGEEAASIARSVLGSTAPPGRAAARAPSPCRLVGDALLDCT